MDIPLSALDPKILHEILLTDPIKFRSDFGSEQSRTETFQDFQENLQNNTAKNPVYVLKRAYYDTIRNNIVQKNQTLEPLDRLLLELHTAIRSLVPNRTDLHSVLQDSHINLPSVENCLEMLPWIINAARALEKLESEARAETTLDWINLASSTTRQNSNNDSNDSSLSFLLSSILYLIDKTEVCHQDKNDFYLRQVLAPRLHNSKEGFSMERQELHNRFGAKPPITEKWIRSLLVSMTHDEKEILRTNQKERRTLIQSGWINDILFQREKKVVMPEIFFWDLEHLQSIRNKTRVAAAGCALGYFACISASKDPESFLKEEEPSKEGGPLVEVMMKSKGYHHSIEEYEQSVEDCVISLAKSWGDGSLNNNNNNSQVIDTLRGQTKSILKGQSPLIQLLDNRMKEVFGQLAAEEKLSNGNGGVPLNMRSGIQIATTITTDAPESSFVSLARVKFQQRGLTLYASQLATAAELAVKVGSLAWDLYGDEFLDTIILEALN